jgi:hypothetical protein
VRCAATGDHRTIYAELADKQTGGPLEVEIVVASLIVGFDDRLTSVQNRYSFGESFRPGEDERQVHRSADRMKRQPEPGFHRRTDAGWRCVCLGVRRKFGRDRRPLRSSPVAEHRWTATSFWFLLRAGSRLSVAGEEVPARSGSSAVVMEGAWIFCWRVDHDRRRLQCQDLAR